MVPGKCVVQARRKSVEEIIVNKPSANSALRFPSSFDFPHGSISLTMTLSPVERVRMTLSNVEEVRVVKLPFEGLRAVS